MLLMPVALVVAAVMAAWVIAPLAVLLGACALVVGIAVFALVRNVPPSSESDQT